MSAMDEKLKNVSNRLKVLGLSICLQCIPPHALNDFEVEGNGVMAT
jgi:hypothetical protein